MLPFMIIGVVELTKIPLAFAAYNAKPGFWKALFIGVLLSLCLITGETIFTGMERSLDNQLKYFEGDKKIQEELLEDVLNLEKIVITLKQERPVDAIQTEFDTEINSFNEAYYTKKGEINNEKESSLTLLENIKKDLTIMHNNASSQDEVGVLEDLLNGTLSRIKDIEGRLDAEVKRITDTAQQEIQAKQNQINRYSKTISDIGKGLETRAFSNNSDQMALLDSEKTSRTKAEKELELITSKRDQDITKYRDEENIKVENLSAEARELRTELGDARLKSQAQLEQEQKAIDIEYKALVARFDSRQADALKQYDEEMALRNKNHQEARTRAERVQADLDDARAEIKSKKEQIIDVEQTINSKAGEIQVMRFAATYAAFVSEGKRQGVENVTPEDIGTVMLFWFGSIALIAATTGTVISFASFYIRDRRNWKYSWKDGLDIETPWQEFLHSRNQKNKSKKQYYIKKMDGEVEPGIIRSISNAIVRLIDSIIRRLTNPKIIKEEVVKYKYIPVDNSGKPLGMGNRVKPSSVDKDNE
jgi:hypothetical protein